MNSLIGQTIAHYHIVEQLGEGGMAIVYKAFDTHLERDVAVKVIRTDQFAPAILEKILKRFEREAKLLAKLSHPNIVGVIDYGEYENIPYLVMEYLPSGTLKERLGKPIPADEAARLLLPIARALDSAHRQGMIHRDVKPSNILITNDGEPMLTDFGIAKLLDAEEGQTLTGTGVGIGTPEYMAPEQWLGQATAKSDQYSLGVIFYEMVTGHKPYTADTPAAILLKQTNDPLPSPKSFFNEISKETENLIYKAMARDSRDRFADMGVFSEALQSLASTMPRRNILATASTTQVDEFLTVDECVTDVSNITQEKLQTENTLSNSSIPIDSKGAMPPPVFSFQQTPRNTSSPLGKPGSQPIFTDRTFWISLGIIVAGWFTSGVVWSIHAVIVEAMYARGYAYPFWLWYVFGIITVLIYGFSTGLAIRLYKKISWSQVIIVFLGFLVAQVLFDILSAINLSMDITIFYVICFGFFGGLGISISCSRSLKLTWWKMILIIVIWVSGYILNQYTLVRIMINSGLSAIPIDLIGTPILGLINGFLTLLIISTTPLRNQEAVK